MVKYYVFAFICSALLLMINFNYNKIVKFLNIYDIPDHKRKIHNKKIPLIGGLIIYFFILFYLFFDLFFLDKSSFFLFSNEKDFFYFILISSAFFLFGIFDDKFYLSANYKLFLYFTITFISLKGNENFLITNINSLFFEKIFYLETLSFFFTSFVILLFIISLNMFDGINMQSGLYILFFLTILFFKFNYNLLFLFIMFIMILIIYLNYKNRIFIGESGINLLGFILSYFTIIAYKQEKILFAEEIFLIMAIPGFDLLRLSLIRIFSGSSPFTPDNRHIHHRLLSKFNCTQTAIYVCIISILPYLLFSICGKLLLSILLSIFLYCLSLYISRSKKI
jgi:UDP-GlcNAc:undecaprenyl-phosphate GlcNAc-1-phosphate transferase